MNVCMTKRYFLEKYRQKCRTPTMGEKSQKMNINVGQKVAVSEETDIFYYT